MKSPSDNIYQRNIKFGTKSTEVCDPKEYTQKVAIYLGKDKTRAPATVPAIFRVEKSASKE
jgi:hypothetical protein